MRRAFPAALSAFFAAVLIVASVGAHATGISNQDGVSYMVMITTPDGTDSIELDPTSEIAEVCEGCQVSLEDGQVVHAKTTDTVTITGGELRISE